ncbi:MAG: terpene cyclase/mutase family protein, partial [Planctomycetaceae bacterium]|nr:terpene cyclase/mutase family protein [Planctomycetaceae bacterium]
GPSARLWFTKYDAPDEATSKPGDPPVERLGPTKLGHAFLSLPPEIKAIWPNCVETIRAQLPVDQEKAADDPAARNDADAKVQNNEVRDLARVIRDQEPRAEQKRVTDLDPEEWKQAESQFGLLRDLYPLKEGEMPMCWRMLGWAEAQSFAELQRRVERDAEMKDLIEQPDKSRGRPVRLRLHIRRLLEWEPPENPLGVKRMYEAWGSASDTSVVPCVVIFTELPAGMKVGEEVRIDGDFAGYFLKVMSYSAQDGKKRGVPLLVGRLQHRAEQEDAPEKPPGEEAPDPDRARRTNAVERAVGFLKSQQLEDGTWVDSGSMTGGTTALATVALLQAGVKVDEAVIQKALPALRSVEPKKTYVVALQTMVLCAATPKQDAELIRRNIAWIEKAQVKAGGPMGGWSYGVTELQFGADGSNSRFAVMGLEAAKRANFEVSPETWQRVASYWLKSQRENGGWGYTVDGEHQSFSMTLAGIGSLATAHRYLPKDDQAAVREAAMRKPHEFIAKTIPLVSSSWPLYSFHCLERAGHLTDTVRFGDVDWKSVVTKRLIDHQRHDGAWVGPSASENELIATSFALMFLSGRPEVAGNGNAEGAAKPKQGDLRSETRATPDLTPLPAGRTTTDKPLGPDQREMRIKPRGGKGATFNVTSHTTQDVPPLQQTLLDGGIEIEIAEGNGAQLRLQADRASILVEAHDQTYLSDARSLVTSLLKLELAGKVTLEFVRQPGDTPIKLKAERLWADLVKHSVKAEKVTSVQEGTSLTADESEFNLPTGPIPKEGLPKATAERLKVNDREAAAKLIGRWMLT